jgi:hypothetical protein
MSEQERSEVNAIVQEGLKELCQKKTAELEALWRNDDHWKERRVRCGLCGVKDYGRNMRREDHGFECYDHE